MADILEHPNAASSQEEVYNFPDGSSITLKEKEGCHLTVAKAVYMLENVKYQIISMMFKE